MLQRSQFGLAEGGLHFASAGGVWCGEGLGPMAVVGLGRCEGLGFQRMRSGEGMESNSTTSER